MACCSMFFRLVQVTQHLVQHAQLAVRRRRVDLVAHLQPDRQALLHRGDGLAQQRGPRPGVRRRFGPGLVEDAHVLGDDGQLAPVVQLEGQLAGAGVPRLGGVQVAALPLGGGQQVAGAHLAAEAARPLKEGDGLPVQVHGAVLVALLALQAALVLEQRCLAAPGRRRPGRRPAPRRSAPRPRRSAAAGPGCWRFAPGR